jgi:hypothetical protein
MSSYRVLVTTSDKYLPALKPFAHLFTKYWSKDTSVLVVGYSEPDFEMPKNFGFFSLGSQANYPFNKWSNALHDVLISIDDEVIVLMLEDYWLTRQVNTHAVELLYKYALRNSEILKIDLCGDRLYALGADLKYSSLGYLDLIKSMPGSPYHMSLLTGLWRRDNLMKAIKRDESPHDMELIGTTRISHMQNLVVIGTRQWPVRHTLGLRGGDHSKLKLDELSKADVDEMRELGFFEPWEGKEEDE